MKNLLAILFFFIITYSLIAQNDVRLGAKYTGLSSQRQGGFFDYSDPESINMSVAVWGFVKYPGRYKVPVYTSVSDLLSYAGGPEDQSHLDDLRLYRVMQDSTQHMFKFNLDDLLWENKIETKNRKIPKLQASDVLVVPGSPKLYFQNWFRVGLSVFSAIISLWLLILRMK